MDTVKTSNIIPSHSRWEILEEIEPEPKKRKSERKFRVRCTCGSGIEKVLAWRYVKGESLSCGCLRRERAAELGRENIEPLRVGYKEYLQKVKRNRPPSKYAPKLPSTKKLRELRESGMTYKAIAEQYGASAQAVRKRLL